MGRGQCSPWAETCCPVLLIKTIRRAPPRSDAAWAFQLAFLKKAFDRGFDKSRRVQVYESKHAANYDFTKNVRMA